jgi:heme exporter protein D
MADFLAMGGYAEFVWSSFGLTAIVMVFNLIAARRRLRVSLERISTRVAHQVRTAPLQQANGKEAVES